MAKRGRPTVQEKRNCAISAWTTAEVVEDFDKAIEEREPGRSRSSVLLGFVLGYIREHRNAGRDHGESDSERVFEAGGTSSTARPVVRVVVPKGYETT
jgi:hypothetical protein